MQRKLQVLIVATMIIATSIAHCRGAPQGEQETSMSSKVNSEGVSKTQSQITNLPFPLFSKNGESLQLEAADGFPRGSQAPLFRVKRKKVARYHTYRRIGGRDKNRRRYNTERNL